VCDAVQYVVGWGLSRGYVMGLVNATVFGIILAGEPDDEEQGLPRAA